MVCFIYELEFTKSSLRGTAQTIKLNVLCQEQSEETLADLQKGLWHAWLYGLRKATRDWERIAIQIPKSKKAVSSLGCSQGPLKAKIKNANNDWSLKIKLTNDTDCFETLFQYHSAFVGRDTNLGSCSASLGPLLTNALGKVDSLQVCST